MASSAPQGEDQIVEALLDAAEQLVAERGSAAVSLRHVADRAGLQHSLIFRYIGRKPDLVRAVHERADRRVNEKLRTGATPLEIFEAIAGDPTAGRLFLRSALDNVPGGYDTDLLNFEDVVSQITEAQADGRIVNDVDPQIVYALGLALGMGWILLEPTLMRALGVHRTDAHQLRERVAQVAERLFAGRPKS